MDFRIAYHSHVMQIYVCGLCSDNFCFKEVFDAVNKMGEIMADSRA